MTQATKSNGVKTWPDWLISLDPKLADSLASISLAHERLRESVANGYHYQHVLQGSINAVTDKMIADGVMSREDYDSPMGPMRKISKRVIPNDAFIAAQTTNNSSSHRILGTATYSCRLAVAKLLDGLQQGLRSGDLMVPFICLRGVIEHVAHYHVIIQKLRPYAVPVAFEEANKVLMEIYALLVKSGYGTRINWNLLSTADADINIESEQLKYRRDENRPDRESKSIMSSIDMLTKSVKGTRAVYDALCEFAHPNVGNLFLFTENVEPCSDKNEVKCVRKKLSPNIPADFLTEATPITVRIFHQIDLCLQHLDSVLADGVKQREKVLKITQMVVRRLVSVNNRVFDIYAPCPCGSEKKLKFCCGK